MIKLRNPGRDMLILILNTRYAVGTIVKIDNFSLFHQALKCLLYSYILVHMLNIDEYKYFSSVHKTIQRNG